MAEPKDARLAKRARYCNTYDLGEGKRRGVLGGVPNVPVDLTIPLTSASPAGIIKGATGAVILDEVIDAVKPEVVVETEGEVVKLRPVDNRSFEWLAETGAAYGKNVLFTFDNDCGQLLVPDCSVSHTPSGNVSDHNQIVFFCGTDFAPGSAEYNNGRASIFTAPGCVASKVTITRE